MTLHKTMMVAACAVAMACAAADGQKRTECHGYRDAVIRIDFPATLAGFSMTTRTTYADGDDDYSLSYLAGKGVTQRELTIYVYNRDGVPLTDGVNDDVVQQLDVADDAIKQYRCDVDSSGMTTEGQFAKCGLKYLWNAYLLKLNEGGKTSSSLLLVFSLRNRFVKLRYSEPAPGNMKYPCEILPPRLSKVLSALDSLIQASEIDVCGIANPTNRLEAIRRKWPRAADRISQWDMPDFYAKFQEISRFQKWCEKDKANRYVRFAVACRDAIAMKIEPAIWYYNLACVFSVTGKPKEAFDALEQAVAAGYNRSDWARKDEDFSSLTNDMRFAKLCEAIDLVEDSWDAPKPFEVDAGEPTLSEDNVYYALSEGSYICDIVTTAACPIVYLNHHKDHDVVPCDGLIVPKFPKEAVERHRNAGAANMHFEDEHASTGQKGTAMVPTIVASNWAHDENRIDSSTSIPAHFGLAGDKANDELTHAVFFNSIGIYAAASDYGVDGIDRFIGHAPFCIAHAGGADEADKFVRLCRDIIRAMPAADRRNAALSTLSIIRRAQKGVRTESDYMSGLAWRPVMEFSDIDVERAISLAKARAATTNMPPFITDATFDAKSQIPCTDLWDEPYDSPHQSDGTLDTCFIARSANAVQRYEVEVKDLSETPGEFVWKVLQGDEKKVRFVPLKDDKSGMRIEVGWHDVFDVVLPNGKKIKSSRVDIGCFRVRNGVASIPAIVSVYFSPNETREYGSDGKLVSIDYSKRQLEGFCPRLCPRGDWKDVLHWNKAGKLTGWTRYCADANGRTTTSEFTREGLMIDTRDALGRPKDVHRSLLSTWKQDFDLPDFTNEVGRSKLGHQGSQYDREEGNPLKTTLAWKYEYKDVADRFGKPSPKDPAPFRYRPELCLRADFVEDSGFRLPIADQMRLGFYTHVGYRHDTIGWSDRADELMREDSRVALERKGLKQPKTLKKMKFCQRPPVTNGVWRVEIDEGAFGLNGRLFELSDGVYRIHVPQKKADDEVTFASARDTYWAANRLLEGEAYARLDGAYRRCAADEVRKVGFRKMPWEELTWDKVQIVTGKQLDMDDLPKGKSVTLAMWQIAEGIYLGVQANDGMFADRTYYFVKTDKSTGKATHQVSFRQLPSMAFGNAVIGADAGDAAAMNNLAVLLYAGIANYEWYDESAVIELLKQAAQKGSETARRNLAILFKNRGELVVESGGLTPHQALAHIRAAKAAGDTDPWTIRVKAGFYALKDTLVFTPADSGTPSAPVTWLGEGEKTVFAGGERLKGWKDMGGGVWSAPVPRAPDGTPAYFEQLWVNGRRADRARLPNRSPDDLRAEYFNVTRPSCVAVSNAAGKVTHSVERVTLTNEAARALAAIPADELPYAQMLVVHKWNFARRILRGVDPATLTVETHGRSPWSRWQVWNARETLVCFENVRAAFDAPGEWFYDAKAGVVLYRPLPGEDMARAEVVAPSSKLSRLVAFRGDPDKDMPVHDIVFRNITFAYSDGTAADGGRGPTQAYQHQAASGYDGTVTAEGARRIAFDRCTFAHTGNYGLRFNDGCVSNTIANCTLFDLGAGGVWMGAERGYVAPGERLSRRVIRTLAPRATAFNRIENCVIRNGGRFNPEGAGVACTHVSDSKVLHCDIHDFYYTGVSVGWTWGFAGSVAQRNEIAFNRIYDLGKGIMSDMGGVYTLGTSFGTRVHHNVIHDVWAYSYGGWALYTDEGSEGITMDHNLCWNTTDGGFHQHYGAGCVIRNNIFAWNRKMGAVRMSRKEVDGVPCTLNFENNIVVVREGPLVGRGVRGVGGIWAGNLWYDCSGGKPEFDGLDWDKWRSCGKEIGGAYADPLFENAAGNDFRLKPDSPAFALGFEAWDYSVSGRKIGSSRFEL